MNGTPSRGTLKPSERYCFWNQANCKHSQGALKASDWHCNCNHSRASETKGTATIRKALWNQANGSPSGRESGYLLSRLCQSQSWLVIQLMRVAFHSAVVVGAGTIAGTVVPLPLVRCHCHWRRWWFLTLLLQLAPSSPAPPAAFSPPAAGGAQINVALQNREQIQTYGIFYDQNDSRERHDGSKVLLIVQLMAWRFEGTAHRAAHAKRWCALQKQCSPPSRIVLPSQSAAAASLQMSVFAGKSMQDIDCKVVRPGGDSLAKKVVLVVSQNFAHRPHPSLKPGIAANKSNPHALWFTGTIHLHSERFALGWMWWQLRPYALLGCKQNDK